MALVRRWRPHGFNIGMNQGAVAGAGIAAHLHQHVVPRWAGDANFLPIIAQTKAMPELLSSTRERLVAAWPRGVDRAEQAGGGVGKVLSPLARALLRMGVSPDAVTVVGALGVVVCALWLFPPGYLFGGTLAVAFFVMSDLSTARWRGCRGVVGSWGAFLDSTLDRVADAAIFSGLVIWLAGPGEDPVGAAWVWPAWCSARSSPTRGRVPRGSG